MLTAHTGYAQVLFFGQVHRAAGYEVQQAVDASKNVMKKARQAHEFNLHVRNDPRVTVLMLPIFDGISIIRKKPAQRSRIWWQLEHFIVNNPHKKNITLRLILQANKYFINVIILMMSGTMCDRIAILVTKMHSRVVVVRLQGKNGEKVKLLSAFWSFTYLVRLKPVLQKSQDLWKIEKKVSFVRETQDPLCLPTYRWLIISLKR